MGGVKHIDVKQKKSITTRLREIISGLSASKDESTVSLLSTRDWKSCAAASTAKELSSSILSIRSFLRTETASPTKSMQLLLIHNWHAVFQNSALMLKEIVAEI